MTEVFFTFKPLAAWPREFTQHRKRGAFKNISYADTIIRLKREIGKLGAASAVIQIAVEEADIQIKHGLPRSSASPKHPGVVLAFRSKFGDLSFPCDALTEWQANLRCIVLYMEEKRRLSRYNVGQLEQEYRGFKALPPGSGVSGDGAVHHGAEWANTEAAATFIINVAIMPKVASGFDIKTAIEHPHVLTAWWREAAKRAHPDADGSEALMSKVNRAREYIKAVAKVAG